MCVPLCACCLSALEGHMWPGSKKYLNLINVRSCISCLPCIPPFLPLFSSCLLYFFLLYPSLSLPLYPHPAFLSPFSFTIPASFPAYLFCLLYSFPLVFILFPSLPLWSSCLFLSHTFYVPLFLLAFFTSFSFTLSPVIPNSLLFASCLFSFLHAFLFHSVSPLFGLSLSFPSFPFYLQCLSSGICTSRWVKGILSFLTLHLPPTSPIRAVCLSATLPSSLLPCASFGDEGVDTFPKAKFGFIQSLRPLGVICYHRFVVETLSSMFSPVSGECVIDFSRNQRLHEPPLGLK